MRVRLRKNSSYMAQMPVPVPMSRICCNIFSLLDLSPKLGQIDKIPEDAMKSVPM
jgi:hypothetical protein